MYLTSEIALLLTVLLLEILQNSMEEDRLSWPLFVRLSVTQLAVCRDLDGGAVVCLKATDDGHPSS